MTSLESSISVIVRIRPFTDSERSRMKSAEEENKKYYNDNEETPQQLNKLLHVKPIRKVVEPVDDRMLVFDPPYTNPLQNVENSIYVNKEVLPFTRRKKTNVGNHSNRKKEHRYVFDKLFDEDATQEDVYIHTGRQLLDSFLDGFNSTIFAYGATGCGKTHTISGTVDSPGIIFLTMKDLFGRIENMKDTYTVELSLKYLEIYNEKLRDLLVEEDSSNQNLVIRENENKKVSVVNISVHRPQSVTEVMDLIVLGNTRRFVCATDANQTSSRSHAVLQVDILKKPKTAALDEEHVSSTLSIIDLAGSERASATRNKGLRLHEGANINKSLLALGNCINALCDPKKRNHVPYRDSNLTRLLKFSLGGNCKTIMIVCISPSSSHYDETLNTLKYANRAKDIKTKVSRNKHTLSRHVMSYMATINDQKKEIDDLKKNSNRIAQTHIKRFTKTREICSKRLLSSIEELNKAVDKHHHIKMGKAHVLANRKFLLVQRFLYRRFLDEFLIRFVGGGECSLDDIVTLDSVFPGLSTLFSTVTKFLESITDEIKYLEQQYVMATDIDYIFTKTSFRILQSLEELESWTQSDTNIFKMHVKLLRDSVERFILFNSSIIFEQVMSKLQDGFVLLNQFMSRSFELLLQINNNDDHLKGELPGLLKELLAQFNDYILKMIDERFKLPKVMSFDTAFTEDDSILASPYHPLGEGDDLSKDIQPQSTPVHKQVNLSASLKRSSDSPIHRTFVKKQSPSLDNTKRFLKLTRSFSDNDFIEPKTKPKKKVSFGSLKEDNIVEEEGNDTSINETFSNSLNLKNSFDTSDVREMVYTGGIDFDEDHITSPLPTKLTRVDVSPKEPITNKLKFGTFPHTSIQHEHLDRIKLNPFANRFQVGSLTKGSSLVPARTTTEGVLFDIKPLPIKKNGNSKNE